MMLQTDTTPSPQRGRDYWQKHVNAWKSSSGTQSSYCRRHNLSERLFSLWKNKFIKEQNPEPETVVDFVPVLTEHNKTTANQIDGVVVTLPNGIRLDVLPTTSGADVAELAKHLMVITC